MRKQMLMGLGCGVALCFAGPGRGRPQAER